MKTWGEVKREIEELGIVDDDNIEWIDFQGDAELYVHNITDIGKGVKSYGVGGL